MSDSYVYTMNIELRSDMCCGTGESDGVAVDQVTALDAHGLPFIPAKRLKGLLREQAAIVAPGDVEGLFGRMGGEAPGKLRFHDAEVFGRDEIMGLIREDRSLSPRRVAGAYTTTRSGTRIESDGVAADHSLRTMQVVKRTDSAGTPTRFTCQVEGEELTEAEKDAFSKAVRCLRGIGMNKNRGFGEVVCSGEWERVSAGNRTGGLPDADGGLVTIGYRIELESGAALRVGPGGPVDYVPGSVVQGLFARELCEKDPEVFQSHVLRNTRFSNAYIEVASGQDGEGVSSEPVPLTYKTRKNAPGKEDLPLYDAATGVVPKPSSSGEVIQQVPISGYGALVDGAYCVASVDESISFHSSKTSSEQGQQFYSVRSIDSGQCFSGTITAASEAITAFREVVEGRGGRFAIGSAGSAGYGSCKLTLMPSPAGEPLNLSAGDRVVVRFVSDVVFIDGSGSNSTDPAALVRELSESGALGFQFDASIGSRSNGCEVFAKNGIVGGYNAHWRLPKRQYMTFSKGSVLVATVTSCGDKPVAQTAWFGLLQTEGFGELRIERLADSGSRTYAKGEPAGPSAEANRTGTGPGSSAVESLKRELAFNDACDKAAHVACQAAGSSFASRPASKSSAMRIGALLAAAEKSPSGKPIDEVFEASAKDNFSHDEVLKRACCDAVDDYRREVVDPYGTVLVDSQKTLLFKRYMQEFLHRVKQLYSLTEGGADE